MYSILRDMNYFIYVLGISSLRSLSDALNYRFLFKAIANVYSNRSAAHFRLGKMLVFILYCVC